MELNLFDEALAWCIRGLDISFNQCLVRDEIARK